MPLPTKDSTVPATARSTAAARSRDALLTAPRPPITRLCLVELRKLTDTPVGIVLLAVGALLVGVFGGGTVLFADGPTYGRVVVMAGYPVSLLAPVLAILLVTSERSQHTAVSTFALVPQRSRVWLAKLLAVIIMALVGVALTLLAGLVITPIGSMIIGPDVTWTVDWMRVLWSGCAVVIATLSGFALALLIGNAPAAIVIVLAWPQVALLLGIVPAVAGVLEWVDLSMINNFSDGITGVELAQVITAITCWIGIPGVLGWVRQLRIEVR